MLMAPSAFTFCARARPAATQASTEVALIAQLQAAEGLRLPLGTTRAVPPAKPMDCPDTDFTGTPTGETLSWVLDSTLAYHWPQVWAPTSSVTYWFWSPKTSIESLKDLMEA